MDMHTRQMMNEAYAEADAAEASADALLRRLEQKEQQTARRQIIRKTVITPRPEPQQQVATTTLDTVAVVDLIRRHCQAVMDALVEANAKAEAKLRADMAKTETALRDEIGSLRAELNLYRQLHQGRAAAVAKKPVPLRNGRHHAA
jgi:hypothetical protein